MTSKKTDAKAVVTLKLYKADELDRRIELLHKHGQSLQAEMHKLACSVLVHLGETSDIRVTLRFLAAMPEMARGNALHAWFETFGPIKFATPEEIKNGAAAARFVKGGKVRLGDAMAKPFWKFKATEGKPYEPLVMDTYLDQQIKRLEKDAKETGADHKDVIAAFRALKGGGAATVN